MDQEASNTSGYETQKEKLALDWERLRFDRKKAAIEFRLKREELAGARGKEWKELLANPFTLAIVGGFITVMSTIISNHLTASANVELEGTKAQLTARAETARAEAAAQAAKQTLQADLIKKFVEGPKTQTVRDNLKFLADVGLLPDYASSISAYLANNPDTAPQLGVTSEARLPVIGGASASSSNWPWLVGLKVASFREVFCQGTLLGPRAVLTAAHCVFRGNQALAQDLSVVVATDDASGHTAFKESQVSKIFVHPSYSPGELKNNIAILELKDSLPPPYVMISHTRARDPAPGTSTMIAAITKLHGLLEAKIPIVDDEVCSKSYPDRDIDYTKNVCAGFSAGGVDTCFGASGGPLAVFDQAGRKYQVGITSWGEGCAQPNKYGVYTRVSAFADWIKQVVPDLPTDANVTSKP